MLPTFIPNHSLHPTFLWSVWTYHLPLSFQRVFVISDHFRKQMINLLHVSVLRCDNQWDLRLIFQQLKTYVNYILHVTNGLHINITYYIYIYIYWGNSKLLCNIQQYTKMLYKKMTPGKKASEHSKVNGRKQGMERLLTNFFQGKKKDWQWIWT